MPKSERGATIKSQKSYFGRLLEQYRKAQRLSQGELARQLGQNGYIVDVSTINKYELGLRTPPAQFIYSVTQYLNLSQPQQEALIEGYWADRAQEFWEEYNQAKK
jgi:transcriptional regulator with XRE-family HTH domain